MTKWMRGVIFIAAMMVAMLAGAAVASVQQPIAVAEEGVTAAVPCEPVEPAVETSPAVNNNDPTEAVTDPVEAPPIVENEASTPELESDFESEAQQELFLPYPIPKIDRSQVFGWVEELLGYLETDERTDLVETWQALARQIEEQPNIVWDELVGDLSSLGAEWLAEQLDLIADIRDEMRSSVDHLRRETMDVIQEHLKPVDETDAEVDADAETAVEVPAAE